MKRRRVRTKDDGALRSLYFRCLAGDPDWLTVEERSRDARIQVVVEELRGELATCPDPEPVLRAIELWEQPESEGPRAPEIVEKNPWRVRRREKLRAVG